MNKGLCKWTSEYANIRFSEICNLEPHIGDRLAHDTGCCRVTLIKRILRQVSDFHYVVIDSAGEIHLCVEARGGIKADFYVDHLSEVTSRFGFTNIVVTWDDPYA